MVDFDAETSWKVLVSTVMVVMVWVSLWSMVELTVDRLTDKFATKMIIYAVMFLIFAALIFGLAEEVQVGACTMDSPTKGESSQRIVRVTQKE